MGMRKGVIIACILGSIPLLALAQKGGESTYSFLGLTNSARVAALGGEVISLLDDDINLVFHNPALLTGFDRVLEMQPGGILQPSETGLAGG